MQRAVLALVALPAIAAAEPRAGRSTFEVDAGPALFDLDETNGGFFPSAALRLAIGRYWSDRFAIGLHFVDHAFRYQDSFVNPMTLAVVGQFWTSATTFVEAGPGRTFQSVPRDTSARYDGWTATARGGVVIAGELVLSAEYCHTWVGYEHDSTNAFSLLVGWQMR